MKNNVSAAESLLNRPLSDEYLLERTAMVAQKEQSLERDFKSAVPFRLRSEWFALPTSSLQETLELAKVHRLPKRSNKIVQGVVNVRGDLVLCIAVEELLALDKAAAPKEGTDAGKKRLIVCGNEKTRFAFIADEVQGVHRFHLRDLTDIPSTLAKSTSRYSKGLLRCGDKMIGYLDDRLLFSDLSKALV